jgi:glycine/D-amino acid oxidase-like deaminating enzyme
MEVNGLYRHGFMISPAMLDVVLELLDHNDSPLARSSMSPCTEPELWRTALAPLRAQAPSCRGLT